MTVPLGYALGFPISSRCVMGLLRLPAARHRGDDERGVIGFFGKQRF
jgi:hypothetical protein